MSSFCTAKATHIFSAKYFSIFAHHSVNFNESLTNDVVSFEQLGPDISSYNHGNISWYMNKRDLVILPICRPLNAHEQLPILAAIDMHILSEASSKSLVHVCEQQRLR